MKKIIIKIIQKIIKKLPKSLSVGYFCKTFEFTGSRLHTICFKIVCSLLNSIKIWVQPDGLNSLFENLSSAGWTQKFFRCPFFAPKSDSGDFLQFSNFAFRSSWLNWGTKKVFFRKNSVQTLVCCEWRAAAAGLKSLRLPHAPAHCKKPAKFHTAVSTC